MDNTSESRILQIITAQRDFFKSGATLNPSFRKESLKTLLDTLENYEERLEEAVWKDLHKCREEAYLTEIGLVKAEISHHISHVTSWARRHKRKTPLTLFPSKTYIVNEPLGCSLIVSPWNYPIQLLLNPLVGAISAGCTAILKPSPYVPTVSKVIEEMISEAFSEKYVAVVQGNREVNMFLFSQKFDMIFFTGSPALGRSVMKAAAEHLTPVVLELGGKSPCIIDATADLKTAARRIAWGKTLNAGQTCIAPDYILIDSSIKDGFVKEFAKAVKSLYGSDIRKSPHFVRLVSDKAFSRVRGYMGYGDILYGGRSDTAERFIEPTLMENVPLDSPLMTEEIFGPIFPVISIDSSTGNFKEQVCDFISSREKPLAFYYFGKEQDGWDLIGRTSSGGGCINDTIMHIANPNVPFGGVGNSGIGHYHGKLSFDAFSHERSVVVAPTWIDLPFRYMPYRLFGIVKRIM